MTVAARIGDASDAPVGVAPTPSHGRLFPEVSAIVVREPDGFVLLGPTGMRSQIRGAICRDIEESLALSAATPALKRLAGAHEALGELARWLTTPSVPLTRLDAVRLDGFDTLFLELLGRCNERCLHCYADASPTIEDALDRDTVFSVIDQARALGFRRIQFTGGDPLLCDFLPEAVARAAERGFPNIEIFTNGLGLTESLLAQLAPFRPSFAFSFYSLDPDNHDRMTRTPGSQRRTLAAIDRVVAQGLTLRAAVTVMDQQTDVQAIVDFLRGRGVGMVSWTRTFSVGRGTDLAETSRQTPVTQASGAPLQVVEGGGHRSASVAGERDRMGKLCITYTGDVVPCIFQRQGVLGSVHSGRPLAEILAGTAAPRSARRGLPKLDAAAQRLQCSSCRLTELGLGQLGSLS